MSKKVIIVSLTCITVRITAILPPIFSYFDENSVASARSVTIAGTEVAFKNNVKVIGVRIIKHCVYVDI